MNFKYYFNLIFILTFLSVNAQNKKEIQPKQQRLANSFMRDGNKYYNTGNYAEAEVDYKKSIATVPNAITDYNLANAMMQQKRYKEAYQMYRGITKTTKDDDLKAKAFHNMGNAQMGLKDYQKAIDAFKNSLRINPDDEETRYNLALAQKFLKDNPPKQNQNKDNKDNKENKENKDNKDQKKDNKDEKKDNKDKNNENKDNKDNQNKDQKEPNKDKNKDQPKDDKQEANKKPQPGKMSEQQMKQLLEALNNEEKKTQEKVKAQKVKAQPQPKEKDW